MTKKTAALMNTLIQGVADETMTVPQALNQFAMAVSGMSLLQQRELLAELRLAFANGKR